MKLQRIISLIMCFVVFVGCCTIPASAEKTESQLKQEIKDLQEEEKRLEKDLNDLKAKKNKQVELRKKLEAKISNLQKQIDICNNKIEKNNSIIAKNEAEIAKQQAEMEQVLLEFKKRIRSIYMSSSTAGGLEILLGAETFSDFIALSQLTQNVSKRDQRMVDEIVDEIKKIEEKSAENKKLIEELKGTKATLKEKQDQLDKEVEEILDVIASIQKDQNSVNADKNQVENDLKEAEDDLKELEEKLSSSNMGDTVFSGIFKWPCPGYTHITSGYGYRWGKLHKGIDISQGGIYGKKVVAAAAGVVTVGCSTCTHDYGKVNSSGNVYSCKCGSYGNYIMIDHGKHGDYYYRTTYAHLKTNSIIVKTGQTVAQGQKIAAVGSTGNSSGWHLHFEIRRGKTKNSLSPVNPKDYV